MTKRLTTLLMMVLGVLMAQAQEFNQMDADGNVTQRNGNFNPNSRDTTTQKDIPRGLKVWTVDRKFGDVRPAEIDTMPHLFMNTTLNTGVHGEYNTTGNNYTARQNRIFTDRRDGQQFMFTEPYSWVYRQPDEFHFTNTLSPITNVTYDNCGNKQNGEDHIDAKFAVNANKRLGMGFNLNYAYARGYFSDQSASHFGATLYTSYLGDRYQMHLLFSNYHQKTSENGGITNDEYITHPESFDDSYAEDEIPTVLQQNWNRNNNQHLLLTHRYSVGFYRSVKMTDEEIKAKQFADASRKEHENKERDEKGDTKPDKKQRSADDKAAPKGRPVGAKIAGAEPRSDADSVQAVLAADTTRIQVSGKEMRDSLLAADAASDTLDANMKKEYVPVTSFIHTLEMDRHDRTYIAYQTPSNYYANTFFESDSVKDNTIMTQLKNTLAIAMLEGFNKYAKAGLKAFVTHELRHVAMPDTLDGLSYQRKWTEHNISLGGALTKTQGQTLHYNVGAELWMAGEDAGQLKIDAATDLNFRLLGDTVQLAAKAALYRLNPTFYQRQYHGRNIWWGGDDDEISKETRTHLEGVLSFRKTNTRLRVAVDEIQDYTYLGMSYVYSNEHVTSFSATRLQHPGNISVLTAQLCQDFRLGPLNWENVVTYQNTSNASVLPLPTLNVFTNLFLKFKIAGQLTTELGAAVTYFSKYYAPDFCPQLNQFAIQQNEESRVELGEYPFVDVYANMHLKRTRFFVMMTNAANGSGNKMRFLSPHYPTNGNVLRIGVSWNFFN